MGRILNSAWEIRPAPNLPIRGPAEAISKSHNQLVAKRAAPPRPSLFLPSQTRPELALRHPGSGRRAVGLRLRVELRRLGRPRQRGGRRMAAGDDLCNFIEIAGSYEALVRDRAITKFLGCEFFLLQSRVCSHACLRVAARQVEHAHVQRVESRERHELEFVTQLAKLLLEAGDSDVV